MDDPFEAYLKVINHFHPFTPSAKVVSDTAVIGKGSVVMPNVFLGNNVDDASSAFGIVAGRRRGGRLTSVQQEQ